ncbi:FAD-dependent oxidoreductase [Legionella brunensis]|uniref:Salicylyl-CoA 5-hydroxylase n=1 Tax=Legionella brunensis TaxID=29422 RepID=A0A0W0S418_9GAMM|nr:hypothetical protein [Legionella brunensis]KTC78050.1 salicylyl-CoA 5-hydroxylase [Legionella brunensis]
MTDVVIVGGGPIGLAHAWGIKKLNPNLEIVVLEKYEEYQRKHTLVMQHEQLKKLMEATETTEDPTLVALLNRLKKDPHIRTNELEQIFKKMAQNLGVKIVNEEVKQETIHEQIFDKYPKARLVIGADGTHSVVSRALFGEDNQVKHEFDYVLQLRYEVKGEKKAGAISTIDFYQEMARQGLIANEYVGSFADGKTPITMQMMISKQAFEALKTATSKNPITPFADSGNSTQDDANKISERKPDELPEEIKRFIYRYLAQKIKSGDHEQIDYNSIRVSVNEAPATHAKQVAQQANHTFGDVVISLGGDAGLGLSYFKGLNAGLESTAQFLAYLKPLIKQGLPDASKINEALAPYQDWFLNNFVPRKIKEVADYSTYRIRSVWKGIQIIQSIKTASTFDDEDGDTQENIIADYFKLLAKNAAAESDSNVAWRAYPHRAYDPVKLGQFSYVPIQHTLRKIAKLFIDYFKPYKSDFQLRQDFKQPLVGFNNTGVGLAKIIVGLFTLDIRRFGDGVFTLLRGAIELATWPLAWFVKPITRGIATLISNPLKIETNKGMQNLAVYGQNYLNQVEEDSDLSPQKVHELLAVCNDLHRKYSKGIQRSQATNIAVAEEEALFKATKVDINNHIPREALRTYFNLFRAKAPEEKKEAPKNDPTPNL